MLKWIDVIKYASQGNLKPGSRVEKTEAEWRNILSEEAFQVTRKHGTERPFSSEMCQAFEPGKYACVCCDTLLFDASEKFDSGTGWPSFTQPVKDNAIAYVSDNTHGMRRVETLCNTCDAHLGHVFQDGPMPSGLRYCMNAVALKKVVSNDAKATFGGGCFWCTEAVFQQLKGVKNVESGYSSGKTKNPTYREICSGLTGHAEVIEVTYDPSIITYEELILAHMGTHDPTTLNRQGADVGTQYRSIILPRNETEKNIAYQVIKEIQDKTADEIVTEVTDFEYFYKAEEGHQNYWKNNPTQAYCTFNIPPKIEKLKKLFAEKMIS